MLCSNPEIYTARVTRESMLCTGSIAGSETLPIGCTWPMSGRKHVEPYIDTPVVAFPLVNVTVVVV